VSVKSELLNEADDAIEHSPLERTITRAGTTVSVFIYRGREDAGWLLEIEDELGGSTVWDEPFESDRAALDEALQTIEQDGIHSFAERESDPAAKRALWDLAVAQPAIAELRRTLASGNGMMGFHGACGVFVRIRRAATKRAVAELGSDKRQCAVVPARIHRSKSDDQGTRCRLLFQPGVDCVPSNECIGASHRSEP
jgi:hypothetical protein